MDKSINWKNIYPNNTLGNRDVCRATRFKAELIVSPQMATRVKTNISSSYLCGSPPRQAFEAFLLVALKPFSPFRQPC